MLDLLCIEEENNQLICYELKLQELNLDLGSVLKEDEMRFTNFTAVIHDWVSFSIILLIYFTKECPFFKLIALYLSDLIELTDLDL